MIAGLPMYDRPELRPAYDHLWTHVRDHLGFGPQNLSRDLDLFALWQSPDLVLGQTCSLPYRLFLQDKVQVLGSADYGLPDTPAGSYYSVLVARTDDPRPLADLFQARVIRNQSHSQSGYAALCEAAQDIGADFTLAGDSGGHVTSAKMVAAGDADLAALDALSWRFMQRYDAMTKQLRVVYQTRPTPSLPFITGLNQDPKVIFQALDSAINSLSAAKKDTLCLYGLVPHTRTDYIDLPIPASLSSD